MAKKWYWSTNLPKLRLVWRPDTAFTPFLRRYFTNERAREIKELKKLFDRVLTLYKKADIEPFKICTDIVLEIDPPDELLEDVLDCVKDLLIYHCNFLFQPTPFDTLTIDQASEEKNRLYAQEYYLTHREACDRIIKGSIVRAVCFAIVQPGTGLFTAPLYSNLQLAHIHEIIRSFFNEDIYSHNLFAEFRETYKYNLTEGYKEEFVRVEDSGLTMEDAVHKYLCGTPFVALLTKNYPIDLPDDIFFSHMHVLGGSGAGKSQFLAQLMLHHFNTDATVIFVDSQGDMIPRLRTLKAIQDRIVYVDPRNPPKLDIFKTATVETLDYLFSGIVGADLTAKQSVFFRYVARLLMTVKNATLLDFLKIMDDLTPYAPYIEKLSDIQRSFFEKDFNSKTFAQTKEQVRYRLHGILENRTLEKLFAGSGKQLDLAEKMDSGSVILIDTSKEYLKSASPHFGRIFIASILQEVYARANKKRHPTFLIIDEAAEYLDQNIDDFLTQARKYKCGVVLAHQMLSQATSELRSSMSANTAIKMVAGVSMADAKALAPDMRTTPEYILSLPRLTFATHIRNVTSSAIPFTVSVGLLDQQEHIELNEEIEEPAIEPQTQEMGDELPQVEEPQLLPPENPENVTGVTKIDQIDTSASENW